MLDPKIALKTLFILLFIGFASGGFAQPDDFELLRQVDSMVFPQFTSFVEMVKVTSQTPEGVEEAILEILFKMVIEEERVQRLALIKAIAPEDIKGSVYLIRSNLITGEEEVFFYKPGLIAPLVIPGELKVFGDVGVAEAAGLAFAGSYSIEEIKESTGDLILELKAVSPSIAYQKVSLSVSKDDLRPKQATLSSFSGMPLKRLIYQEFTYLDSDDIMCSKILIENLLFEARSTIIEATDIREEDLPIELFSPENLTNIR